MENFKVYQSDDHSIFHGNALDVLKSLPKSSVDLIFADPPYNIGKKYVNFVDKWPSDEAYIEWCKEWLNLSLLLLKPNGSLYVMTSTQNMPFLDIFLREKLTILSRIVWHYDSSGVQARKYFGSKYEPILHCVKDPNDYVFNADDILVEAKTGAKRKLIDYRKKVPTVYNSEKVPGNVWYFPRVRYRMPEYEKHPTQKPETLLERIIAASSNEGDLVLDPFSGTFTTCAVAKKLNRKSIGIELEEEYIKIGLRRLSVMSLYNGEKLHPVEKIYERKNGKPQVSPNELTLLESNE
ncbi:adenine-specific DNA-methyltransferase [Candidatus Leptofilum sp.]|uniref:adenine-specific DNA-methyltransferase n=1 Tax=Candidatus Leptofilum sp. TaxID=3241576 RepID=UPI003B5AAC77